MPPAAVIVAYRHHPWLGRSIASAVAAAGDVVVVDNGSEGSSVSAEARLHGARSVRLAVNAGFPAAVNAGLAAVSADVVGLLNDDAVAEPDWLTVAAEALADPTVAAVSPKLLLVHPYLEVRLDDGPWSPSGDGRPLGRMLREVRSGGEDVLADLLGPGVHALEADGSGRWRWTAGREPFYVPLPVGAATAGAVPAGEATAGGATAGPVPAGEVTAAGEATAGAATAAGEATAAWEAMAAEVTVNGAAVGPCAVRVVDLINNAGSYLSAEGHGGDYGFETPDGPAFAAARDCFAACGAAMVARRETWERVGPLAASFFAYNEDTDWCWRARLAGLRIRYEPAAVVRHVRALSTGGPNAARFRLLAARNRYQMLARNAPLPVLRAQLRRVREPWQPPGLARPAAWRAARGLAERRGLARGWVLSPAEVWAAWAGVEEGWPADGGRSSGDV